MKIELIVRYLQQQMGMNPDAVGFDTMKKAIFIAMSANELNDLDGYYQLIQQDSSALQKLIETVVIPETSFFRDKKPFQVLKSNLRPLYRALCDEGEPLKILSVPSSTGEEPYSIAMTCLEAGLKYGEFEILACDISQRVLEVAERGLYSDYSFRGGCETYQQRYFTHKDNLFQINESLRNSVTFFQGNLIGDHFIDKVAQKFHIIFCRNLLIYFDKNTKYKAVSVIDSLLHDEGLLVVGHADTAILSNLGYRRFSDQLSFTYVKSHNTQQAVVKIDNSTLAEKGKRVMAALVAARTDIAPPQPSDEEKVSATTTSVSLKSSRNLIQEFEALLLNNEICRLTALCLRLIKESHESGIANHYLARIAFLEGDMQLAEERFKKAIYLRPDDEKALHFLAEISKKQGDEAAAQRYQQRANRIKARTSQSLKSSS